MKMGFTAGISILTIMIWPAVAAAKPKKVSNGCTAAQIQSPAASDCINQMEQDVINNRPTIHAVYCSSTGKILCCEYAGNTIVDHSCTVVGRKLPRTPPVGAGNLPTLKVE